MPPKKPDNAPADDMDDDDLLEEDERKVPYSRFRQAIRRMRAAEAKVRELEDSAEEWAAERETLTSERDQLRTQSEGWEVERAAMAAGLTDPEGLDLARVLYARVKPEDRPKGGIAGWLKDRDALPKGLRTYLATEDGDKSTTTDGKGDKGKGAQQAAPKDGPRTQAPPPDRGVRAASGSGAPYTGKDLARMSPQDYAAQRSSVWDSVGVPPIRRVNEKAGPA